MQACGYDRECDPGQPDRREGAGLLHGEAAEVDAQERSDLVAQENDAEEGPEVPGPERKP